MYNKVSFRKVLRKDTLFIFYHLYVPFFLHIHKKRRDEGWGLLKRQNGYICIMDVREKLCEKFTKYIPLPKERLYRFLISKGMYRPVMRGSRKLKS